MYQLEVKQYLIENKFNPLDGWEITVDIDAMERAKGPQHKPDKKERVKIAENELKRMGATIGPHNKYGRIDVCTTNNAGETYLIEVEGKSSRQKEQAMYSALGQLLLIMNRPTKNTFYGIAVPDTPEWEIQLSKIPTYIKNTLNLKCYLTSKESTREI
ncbi:MAG: hypothetical protein ABFS18_04485 [Thermodesulfobacteriota bacterium]